MANKGKGNEFELPVVARLDTSAAAIKELQNQLDAIGKKLKITIGQVAKASKQEEEQRKQSERKTNEIMEQVKAERILFLQKETTRAQYKANLETIRDTVNASEKELLTQNQMISLLARINSLEDKGLNSKIQKVKIVRKEVSELYKRAGQAELQRIQGEISPETYRRRIQSYLKYNEKLKTLGQEEVFTHSQKVSLSKKVEVIGNRITQTENQSLKTQKAINDELNKRTATPTSEAPKTSNGIREQLTALELKYKTGQLAPMGGIGTAASAYGIELEKIWKESEKIEATDSERLAIANKILAVDKLIKDSLEAEGTERDRLLKKETDIETKKRNMLLDIENLQKKYPDVFKNKGVSEAMGAATSSIQGMTIADPASIEKATEGMKKLRGETEKVRKEMASGHNEGKGFFKTIAADFGKFTMWMVSATLVMGPIRKIREAFDFIAETDKNLTNIGLVLGKTTKQLDGLATSYNKLAMEMGVTTSEVLVGATEWFRQGKNFAETEELLRSTMMLSKLGAVDSAQATEYLTSTLNGFRMGASQAVDVVDKLVAVDNAAATSVSELAIALQRSSNSASQAGVSIDELVGYVGTVSSVTRKSAKFGPLCYNT